MLRRVVSFLLGLSVAAITANALSHGTYCLVPSTLHKAQESGTAETSIYGVVLYEETGMDYKGMYDRAVWWYEATLIGIWVVAILAGIGVYVIVGSLWRHEVKPSATRGDDRR